MSRTTRSKLSASAKGCTTPGGAEGHSNTVPAVHAPAAAAGSASTEVAGAPTVDTGPEPTPLPTPHPVPENGDIVGGHVTQPVAAAGVDEAQPPSDTTAAEPAVQPPPTTEPAPIAPTTEPAPAAPTTGAPTTQPTILSALGRLNNARAHLDDSGFYLGSPMVSNGVEWMRDGKCERLVEKRMPPLEPADGSEPASTQPDCDTLHVPKPAYLSFVGTISSTDFFLTADGGWHGPTQYTPTLDKVKASCTVEAPAEAPFAADFATVLRSITDICKMSATPGFSKINVLVGLGETRIKLRHALFEPKSDADEEDDDEAVLEGADVPGLDDIDFQKGNKADVLNLNNWPVSSDAAREALKDMAGKFFVVPIPAYDMHGELIHPSFYRRRLENALVAVRFTLTHWSIKKGGGSGSDAYIANIVNIRVLAPPKPSVVTPRKRGKVPTFDPLSPLPLDKKRRLFE